ncbi:glycosyltransferase family 2 protein [Pinisolibacter sp.]|uniref:glycosyltransferase family 2 protein n=1 Tax=Pinisolibacter sp. TaxID=2172024 RepID=UPI002FDE7531
MARTNDGTCAVTVVIAAYAAHDTIVRAVASLLAQTRSDWEAILVADDGSDYAATLAAAGLADPRIRHLASGGIATGCAAARNAALAHARGSFVTRLDADDEFEPDRLARLLPTAAAHGSATDMVRVLDHVTGDELRGVALPPGTARADAARLAMLHCPLAPMVARHLAPEWFAEADIAEDVLYLFAVEERAGPIAVLPEPLYRYRVRTGSMCHDHDGADRAERSYAAIDARLASDGFGRLSPTTAARARPVFAAMRAFNRRFAEAEAAGFTGDFQRWCAANAAATSPTTTEAVPPPP